MRSKIWDIKQPKTEWDKGYAKLEYQLTALKQTLSTKIIVEHIHTHIWIEKIAEDEDGRSIEWDECKLCGLDWNEYKSGVDVAI